MILSSIVQVLLSSQDVPYRLVNSANLENTKHTHASVSLLKDASGIVMAIYNNGDQLDIPTLKALIERPELRFMSIKELDDTLSFLKSTKVKPFNKIVPSTQNNEIQLIIDEPMSTESDVLLVTDNPSERIQVDIWDMQVLIENALIGGIFSHEHKHKVPSVKERKSHLLEQLKNIDQLPAIPPLAADLLKLQANPDGTVDDMVQIISRDPILTVQILRYANSALFGFSGQIATLQDAIFRVLGYETVLYMSFGATLGRSFKLPQNGRLSMGNFWKEAIYCASLCQQLAQRMPQVLRPTISIAYVTGLLHNVGLVFMGSLFHSEFDWLNKMLSSRPQQSLIATEQKLFDCTHTSIGEYLMQCWNMPKEITAVVAEHHNMDYKGEQSRYVWLTQLACQALSSEGLSDTENENISKQLCQQLGLTETDLEEALSVVMAENTTLDAMAETLCS